MRMLVMTAWWLWCSVAGAWEWRTEGGGEANADPHGILTVQIREGPMTFSLYTDTLDLRYAPEFEQGRAWFAARFQGGSAGLMMSPWTDGAKDPANALRAFYGGAEAGAIVYGPRGTWVGIQAMLRLHFFASMPKTTRYIPGSRFIATGDLLAGIYRPWIDAWVRAGFDLSEVTSPHIQGQARFTIPAKGEAARWSPILEFRGGWAKNQDEVTLSRLGGLNPYVVPLAGAAWAEFWVQDYAATRVGPAFRFDPVTIAPVVDIVWFNGDEAPGRTEVGIGLISEIHISESQHLDVQFGYAPTVEREQAVAMSGYVLYTTDWRPLGSGRRK